MTRVLGRNQVIGTVADAAKETCMSLVSAAYQLTDRCAIVATSRVHPGPAIHDPPQQRLEDTTLRGLHRYYNDHGVITHYRGQVNPTPQPESCVLNPKAIHLKSSYLDGRRLLPLGPSMQESAGSWLILVWMDKHKCGGIITLLFEHRQVDSMGTLHQEVFVEVAWMKLLNLTPLNDDVWRY